MTKRRIGIMGGTFDPIHIGHLILGEAAHRQFQLETVYFMPSGNPPHKRNRAGRATDEQRVEMVRRAIASNPHFKLSEREMHPDGYSFTYRTLEALNAEHPDCSYYFIIGADSLFDFDTWREPARIAAACSLVVATRNQTDPVRFDAEIAAKRAAYQSEFLKLDTPNLDISSHHLREMIQKGEAVKYYLQDSVIEYIQQENIYHEETE